MFCRLGAELSRVWANTVQHAGHLRQHHLSITIFAFKFIVFLITCMCWVCTREFKCPRWPEEHLGSCGSWLWSSPVWVMGTELSLLPPLLWVRTRTHDLVRGSQAFYWVIFQSPPWDHFLNIYWPSKVTDFPFLFPCEKWGMSKMYSTGPNRNNVCTGDKERMKLNTSVIIFTHLTLFRPCPLLTRKPGQRECVAWLATYKRNNKRLA